MNSLDEKNLRRMSCAELRKCAKTHGIKANMKAENIIAALLKKADENDDSFVTLENKLLNSCKKNKENLFDKDRDSICDTPRRGTYTVDDEDSFVVLERKILNSCKKNKENLFDKDKEVICDTPRRETYTVDDPAKDIKTVNASLVGSTASPELKMSAKDETLNVTLSRGSEKKSAFSKRKVSFMTPLRRSTRLSAATPVYNSIKDRPKTPMPAKLSVPKLEENNAIVGSLDLDISVNMDSKKSSGGRVKRPSTPMPLPKQKKRRLSSIDRCESGVSSTPNRKSIAEVVPVLQQLQEEDSDEISNSASATPVEKKDNAAKIPSKIEKSVGLLSVSSSMKKTNKSFQKGKDTPAKFSARKVHISTPAFKKIQTPILRQTRTSPRSNAKLTSTPGIQLGVNKNFGSAVKVTPTLQPPLSAIKKSATKTPNFNKIHQKAMDKMESIDDYHKRREQLSSKKIAEQQKFHTPAAKTNVTKKPAAEKVKKFPITFSGIPFVPVAASTRSMKFNFQKSSELIPKTTSKPLSEKSVSKKLTKAGTMKRIKHVSKENAVLKRRYKFDLKASLAKKLPYKPHTGPLKPLGEGTMNNTVCDTPIVSIKVPENQTVKSIRIQSREVLRGVRKNRRFNLQMNNRNLNVSVQ